ncbi:hypothetical protein AB0G82_12680 [Streptomyces anulatus]|uniref:hypothetical protein n=1 Tax=Streptomyces TaxID=1883 RepID=UPI001B35B834|nr:hypothetical protein [Streptomyces sp. C3-3]MBQ1115124.1 hypothetical protein [Streptomyces sp. C3-3]
MAFGLGEPLLGERGHHLLVDSGQFGEQGVGQAGEGVRRHDLGSGMPIRQVGRVGAVPAHTRLDLAEGVMLFLRVEEAGTGGVEREQGAREPVGEKTEDLAHLGFVQVGQHGLRDEQVRLAAVRSHLGSPCLFRHRGRDHRPPRAVGEELLAQADHVGQIEFEPAGAAVVDAFVPRAAGSR